MRRDRYRTSLALACLAILAAALVLSGGCTRAFYRNWADRETFDCVQERNNVPVWHVPDLRVYPDPRARFFDPFNPDREAMPPDDPAADKYMIRADGHRGWRGWHHDGDAPWIEDPSWRDYLELDKDCALLLKQDTVVELGVIHSREYQNQLESLYLNALALTLNRFEFALHWFATNTTFWTDYGSTETGINNITTNSNAGFTRNFTAGGQFLIDFANSYVFQFSGLHHSYVNSNILINLTQPLLRRAGIQVRMENLTEAERSLLYQLRFFAHFRKSFAVDLANQTFLNLLFQEQVIRNQRENVKTLEQSYTLYEALLAAGIVSGVQVDQIYQQLQQGRAALIRLEADLQTALDNFKIALGLPPTLDVKIDDTLLKPFQLTDPKVIQLQRDIEKLQAEYRELDQLPTKVKLESGYKSLKLLINTTLAQAKSIRAELEAWQKSAPDPKADKAQLQREKRHQENVVRDLADTTKDIENLNKASDLALARIASEETEISLRLFQKQSDNLVGAVNELYAMQAQIRAYMIKLKPVMFDLPGALEYAEENRFDLMNERGRVIDTWRQVTVTANALEAGFDVVFNGNLATEPRSTNPVDYRLSASSFSLGFAMDAPLNRLAERNTYRASQIAYQRERREFMLLSDTVARSVRLDLRLLNADRLNFDIARQRLISVARQVEAAREDLVVKGASADPTSTLNILQALTNLLDAQNGLIQNWVSYEQHRIQLLLDTEALEVDDKGMYIDEYDPGSDGASQAGRPAQPGKLPESLPEPRPLGTGPPDS